MNVRGERILIFGDSLTHHGADNGPETWDVNAGSSRASSAPGDLLASMLLEQGASAVRTNARVGRSATNFYERENASDLLAADRSWRPTKVVIMLGTNDLGRAFDKTTAAMAGLKSAYEGMGAEVWAIGPFTYNNGSLNAQAPEVAQIMHNVFGARFIDGRPLSVQTGRTSDGVHFGQAAAKQTALNIANALMTKQTGADTLGALALGAGLALGALALFKLFSEPTRQRSLADYTLVPPSPFSRLLGAPSDPEKPSIDELARRARNARKARESMVRDAFGKSSAIILTTKDGDEKLAILSGEMQNTQHGKHRVTYFGKDGPIGHATRTSLSKIVEDVIDYYPTNVRPATEAEVMKWTSTEEFEEGARRVAEVQRLNSGLKGGKRRSALGAAEGYRVAYVLVTKRGPLRAVVDAPRPLTLAEAEKWRRKWGKSDTAWVETMDGELVPVKGAKRAGKFVDDAKPGDVHWTLTR